MVLVKTEPLAESRPAEAAVPPASLAAAAPARPHQTLGRLLWPVGLLTGGLVTVIAVLLLFAAHGQNELASKASEHLARGVFAAEADSVMNHTRDYATWTEAVDNLLMTYNADWIEQNIGSWAYEGLNMDATVVVDSAGAVIYGMSNGELVGAAVTNHVTDGLRELIAKVQAAALEPGATDGSGLALSAHVLLDGAVAIAAAAPLVYTDGRLPFGPGKSTGVLVYVRALDAELLEAISQRYLLSDLHLVPPGDAIQGASFPLTTASGTALANVVWQPERPGFDTIRPLLVPGVLTVVIVGILLWLAVSRAQRTARDLEASHRTLEELTVSLAAARDRAERQTQIEADLHDKAVAASRAKSEFLALVSHELRTPLNAILGFSETIANQIFGQAATERYREYARDIHESGSHLLSIINDILDLSKIEAGRYELHEEKVALADVLERCAALLRERASQRQLALTCRAGNVHLHADPRALKQVVFNLVSNAIKYTDAGGRIELATTLGAKDLQIVVTDTGIGMSEEDLERAFQPFGQAYSARNRASGGTGLGLNVTQALIALHGGELEIRSAPGKGTTAVVHLPLDRLLPGAPQAAASQRA